MEELKQPQIGLVPKEIWAKNIRIDRHNLIVSAIKRYNQTDKQIPSEWLSELIELEEYIRQLTPKGFVETKKFHYETRIMIIPNHIFALELHALHSFMETILNSWGEKGFCIVNSTIGDTKEFFIKYRDLYYQNKDVVVEYFGYFEMK